MPRRRLQSLQQRRNRPISTVPPSATPCCGSPCALTEVAPGVYDKKGMLMDHEVAQQPRADCTAAQLTVPPPPQAMARPATQGMGKSNRPWKGMKQRQRPPLCVVCPSPPMCVPRMNTLKTSTGGRKSFEERMVDKEQKKKLQATANTIPVWCIYSES